MKVLWFSLSPCGSLRRNNTERFVQGWMISLEDEIKKCEDIDLSVAYFSDKREETFDFEGVHYYPMGETTSSNPIKRITNRMLTQEEKDKIKLPLLLWAIEQSKPDLIHIHGTEDSFGLVIDHIKNIPVVFSIQGLMAPITEKFLAGISLQTLQKQTTIKEKIKHITIYKQYLDFVEASKRENRILTKAKYIFGRTCLDRRCTLTLNPHRQYFVVNEIMRNEFYSREWKGTINKHLQIVSTISGMLYKGLETVLKTANILKEYSDIEFKWLIVGMDNSERFIRISEAESSLESPNCNVEYVGKKTASQLADLLSQSDLYVHPSHIENSPNSVCEAMLVGTPVIATNVGGTSTMLVDNEEGLLVQEGEPYSLAGAIVELYQNPDVACRYSYNAKLKAKQRHNPQNIVQELLTGYKSIIKDFNQ